VRKRGRYALQRQSPSSLTWRTVLRTDSKEAANACFLAHSTQLRRGCNLRLLDEWEDLVLAKASQPVHSAPADSTC